VPIYAASKDRSFDDIRTALGNLVRNFEADASASRKQIRDLLDNDRELFYATSIEILKSAGDSRGAQYLVALLVSNGMLLRALCNPDLSREEALSLGRSARRVDPMVDVALARSLADSSVEGGAVHVADPAKLMDVLCEIAEPGRIMPSLMRMMRHPNPYLRSKAVKMIGRGSMSAKWVMGRLNEPDPRIRANAIESMWGVDTPEARSLLSFATNDGNNRVVGNALLGLYYLGDASVLADVIKLTAHESAAFRASSAWVMGETGDPRFTESLRRLISERDATVRKRAFAALGQLKAANTQPPAGEPWHLAGRMLGGESLKGLRRLMLAVAGEDMREQPKAAPLQFVLSEGNQYITSYKVSEKPLPDAMSVVFVIPRSRGGAGSAFFEGALSCLRWKRPSDLWSVLPYIETGDGEPPPPHDPEPPLFTSHSEALEAALSDTPKRANCTDLWTAVWRATKDGGQARGKRHVIVFSTAEEGRIAGHGLIANLQGGRIPMQVIASGPNQQLQEFCQRSHTWFRNSAEEELVETIEQAYLNMLARYEIAYQPVAVNAPVLKVRVQTPTGWGETLIAAPSEPEAKT
jgi:hypothetical protein